MEQLRRNLKRERDRIRSESEVEVSGGSGNGNGRKGSPSKSNSTKKSDEERIKEVVQKYMERTEVKGSKGVIPTLQYGAGMIEDEVQYRIRMETKRLVWNRMSSALLDQDDLMLFYGILEKYAVVPSSVLEGQIDDQKHIIYADYLKAKEECDSRIKPLLTAKLFMRLITDDPYGRVMILHIFNFVMKKTWLKQTRIGLMSYDFAGKGFLTEEGLDSYLRDLIPTLPQLNGIDPTFEPFYVCTAARKFFFFLDPQRKLKIRIVDILASGLIDDILDLREAQMPAANWFCMESAMRVYGHYLHLDKDHNGMLNKSEFKSYSNGPICLTEAFVDKLFNKCITYDGEMDYRTYVDFVLAMENKKEPQSIQYLFRVIDINQKGYLDASDLHYFYKDIYKVLSKHSNEVPKFDDVKDEIFDMVKPKDPLKITIKDLVDSEMGDTVISILIDTNGFWSYDNRESLGIPDMKENSSEV